MQVQQPLPWMLARNWPSSINKDFPCPGECPKAECSSTVPLVMARAVQGLFREASARLVWRKHRTAAGMSIVGRLQNRRQASHTASHGKFQDVAALSHLSPLLYTADSSAVSAAASFAAPPKPHIEDMDAVPNNYSSYTVGRLHNFQLCVPFHYSPLRPDCPPSSSPGAAGLHSPSRPFTHAPTPSSPGAAGPHLPSHPRSAAMLGRLLSGAAGANELACSDTCECVGRAGVLGGYV
eukprot:351269-Chlamydomonas_euryale.AAC.2